MITLDSGGAGVGGLGACAAVVASADHGGQLKGGCAQEDDQQQVEDGRQEGAHKVGGDAAVGANTRVVEHVEGVALILHGTACSQQKSGANSIWATWHANQG